MKKIITTFIIVAIVITITMIHNKQQTPKPQITNIELIKVDGSLHHNAMDSLIAPYKQLKEESMNVVIGESTETIEIGKPESKLTNLIADILLTEARKYIPDTDMAITNIGGIRRPLYQGNITIGDVFEILPFDNALLVFEYKGSTIIRLADAIATKGGESISGMTLTPKRLLPRSLRALLKFPRAASASTKWTKRQDSAALTEFFIPQRTILQTTALSPAPMQTILTLWTFSLSAPRRSSP